MMFCSIVSLLVLISVHGLFGSYINLYSEKLNVNLTNASPSVSISGVYNDGTVFPDKYVFTLNAMVETDASGATVAVANISQNSDDYKITTSAYDIDGGTNPVQEVKMETIMSNGAWSMWDFQLINNPTTIEWSNITIHTKPFSGKLSAYMNNWPWRNESNLAALEIEFTFPHPLISPPLLESNGLLLTIKFNTSNSSLFFNAPTVLELDGVLRPYKPIPRLIFGEGGIIGMFVRFLAPVQFKELVFDPDFSVLITNDPTKKRGPSAANNLTSNTMIGVAVGVSGGVVLLIVVGVVLYFKVRSEWAMRKEGKGLEKVEHPEAGVVEKDIEISETEAIQ